MKKVSLWQLFATFFKTGLFTFGGGYAMISILQEELVANKKWITSGDMMDMVIVAESTPGVIAVNTATSVGYKMRGVLGAIIATLGVVLPSFLIISALSYVIDAFQDNVWYQSAFKGIQCCVTVLVVNAFIKMSKQISCDFYNFLALAVAFGVATFTDFNVIFLILSGAVCGLTITLVKHLKAKKQPLAVAEVADISQEDAQTQAVDGDSIASQSEEGEQ